MSDAAASHPAPASDPEEWARVMELTREILQGARAGEWERVCTLQESRFSLIQHYFAGERSTAELDGIRPQVNSLLDMDAETAALGMRRRTELGEELRQIRRGRTARKAYGG